ncbi:MAG: hypothetical protein OHK0048_20070 [Rhodoferax sp.]
MHESRLDQALRALLARQRVAALGTLGEQGQPFVSMVPYAVWDEPGELVIHVSLLAPHTRNLLTDPRVGFMVQEPEVPTQPVHALQRVSIDALARRLQPDSEAWHAARAAYLARFPEAQPMTELGDFSFVALRPTQARHVAGFGTARPIEVQDLVRILRAAAAGQ